MNKEIIIRKVNKNDNIKKISELLYKTDNYIYNALNIKKKNNT